jgi:hypothetical protein
MKEQRYFSKAKLHVYEGEREIVPNRTNILTSGYPVANPKCGPDYSVFIKNIYIYIYIYILILYTP